MKNLYVLSGVACFTVLLTTGAFAEIVGEQPGTSKNPADNVPAEIQRSDPSGEAFGSGGTGPGTRGKALTGGQEKEKPDHDTRREVEKNAKYEGGGAAIAAENLNEKDKHTSKKVMKHKQRKAAAASDVGNDGPKQNPKEFQQERSDKAVQGQGLVNAQPMEKQQPANR